MGPALDEAVAGVLAAPPRLGRVRVLAVDGPSGSGKSMLAAALAERLAARVAVELVSADDFATWAEPASWWPRLADGVFAPLRAGRAGRYRRTEWSGGVPAPGAVRVVPVPDVLVVEGVSVGRRSARDALSRLLWVECPGAAARLERAVARDGEPSREALAAWQRFERGWFAVDDPMSAADQVVDIVGQAPTCRAVPGDNSAHCTDRVVTGS